MIKKFILAVALLISTAFGEDLYLAQGASGLNDASSCANAKAISFFNGAGNWGAGAGKISPGDTVHLCGGISGIAGSNLMIAQGGGTIGNPITVFFEVGASLQAPYFGTAINLSGHDYLIVDGGTPCGTNQGGTVSVNICNGTIQNTNNGSALTNKQHSEFIQAKPCNNCEIKNLALINNYIHVQCETTGCDTAAGTVENAAINMQGHDSSVHDNLIHDCSWCVNDQAATGDVNVSFYNNNIYNAAHGIALFGGVTWPGPVIIYNNRIHDYQNWDTGVADAYHADGIHAFGMNLAAIYIHENYFTTANPCCITAHIFLEGTSGGSQWTTGGSYFIFNNVFLEPTGDVNGLVQPYLGSNTSILYNNTLVGPGSTTGFLLGPSGIAIKILNNAITTGNILMNLNGDLGTTFTSAPTDLDYQAYANCGGFNCLWWHVATANFATWQANCDGCDTHSTLGASLNLNSDGSETIASVNMIGKGKNLTSLCSGNLTTLCNDILGQARPSSDPWDIGAYQFSGTSGTILFTTTGVGVN